MTTFPSKLLRERPVRLLIPFRLIAALYRLEFSRNGIKSLFGRCRSSELRLWTSDFRHGQISIRMGAMLVTGSSVPNTLVTCDVPMSTIDNHIPTDRTTSVRSAPTYRPFLFLRKLPPATFSHSVATRRAAPACRKAGHPLTMATHRRGSSTLCPVCLEVFAPLDVVTVVTCGHAFHWRCLQPWLRRNSLCPCCR